MSKQLIVVGGGGFAMEVYWLAEEAGWTVLGFLDDDPSFRGKNVLDKPVLGTVTSWDRFDGVSFVVAVVFRGLGGE